MDPNNQETNREESTREASSFNATPQRKNTRSSMITLAIVLFIVLIAGMFIFAFMWQRSDTQPQTNNEPSQQQDEGPYANIDRVDAKHFYSDGTHTLVGEIPMPTPCDLLNSDATVAESDPEQVTINFTVVNESDTCAQVVTPQRFKVEVDASDKARFSATLQGRPIQLNLIAPEPGETPDDFELYLKG